MITDQVKDMLEAIRGISEYCRLKDCADCPFNTGTYECQMEAVADSVDGYPVAWDVDMIENVERKLKL